jgi:hypothetical protein
MMERKKFLALNLSKRTFIRGAETIFQLSA